MTDRYSVEQLRKLKDDLVPGSRLSRLTALALIEQLLEAETNADRLVQEKKNAQILGATNPYQRGFTRGNR